MVVIPWVRSTSKKASRTFIENLPFRYSSITSGTADTSSGGVGVRLGEAEAVRVVVSGAVGQRLGRASRVKAPAADPDRPMQGREIRRNAPSPD